MALNPLSMTRQVQQFHDALVDRGLRLTQQRESIFRCLMESRQHLSAEDLHRIVRGVHRSVGFATVYRTLRLLVDTGLVEVRQFGDGVQRYENAAVDHHDHMVCLDCRAVFEFESEAIEHLQRQAAGEMGFEIARHRLDLYVRCQRANCSRRPSPSM